MKPRTALTIEVPTLEKYPKQYRVCLVREQGSSYGKSIELSSPEMVYKMAWEVLQHSSTERFVVFALNTKNRLIGAIEVSVGDVNSAIVTPREVFTPLAIINSAAFVAVHNHPSGDCTPSQRDVEVTNRLRQCSELMGIKMLDHVVVAAGGYYSFQKHGFFASSVAW